MCLFLSMLWTSYRDRYASLHARLKRYHGWLYCKYWISGPEFQLSAHKTIAKSGNALKAALLLAVLGRWTSGFQQSTLKAVSFSFEQFVNSFFFLWFHIQTSEECRLTCGQGCHQSGEPDNTKTTLIVKCRLCKPNAPYREICLEFHMWEINVTIYTSLFYQQRHAKRYFVQVINPGVVFV